MCGIIGYIGKNDFIKVAHQGLLNLEYRGYDSAGISFFQNNKIESIKSVGNVESLFKKVKTTSPIFVGIGHTRWATHGKISDQNCHPHYSQNKKIFVVHNGIIENYQLLKQKYLKNVSFYSETDTEVIPNLIEFFYQESHDELEAIQQTIALLKGSFALAIMFDDAPQKIYFAKNSSPLLIGIGDYENYISSDILGFADKAQKCIYVDDMCYGFVTSTQVEVFKASKKIELASVDLPKSAFQTSRGEYPFYMLKEINDIPLAVAETCKLYEQKDSPLSKIPTKFFEDIDEIIFVACGTSYHSGLVGQKYVQTLAGIKSKAIVASEFIYEKEILTPQTLCVFISQSGETADTLTAIKKAQSMQAKTIGITNVKSSSIARLCDHILPLQAGSEVAVASTKAYNAQLVVLLIFASFLANNFQIDEQILSTIKSNFSQINIKNIQKSVKNIAKMLKNSKNIYLVGRDFDYVTSLEASLKIKEISYIPCEAYPAGELKHGTLALIEHDTPAIAIVTQKSLVEKTMSIVSQIKARGGKMFVFTNQDLFAQNLDGCMVIPLPKVSDELVSPISSVIAFQLLAYNLTLERGYNPDRPRNLAKSVTVE